jgi:hypothetical protein
MKGKELEEFVYQYPTKYKQGFLGKEIEAIKTKFPKINEDKFFNALKGITCQMEAEGLVIFHCDILNALRCGLENRDMDINEWD